ncbi:MAG: glycosyltransferase [Patescibacteria group bacterium]
MSLAPIALFTYNRLEHTQQTLAALAKNESAAESDLIIFSDGAKNDKSLASVQAVRTYLKTVTGFKSVKIIEREKNLGLADSIIKGVTEIIRQFTKIIVLEDDLITAPYFLKYLNEALDRYAENDKIISIHGYVYPTKRPLPETFFLRGADCWGWATWKRGWDLLETDSQKLLTALRAEKLGYEFDLDGSYPYLQMLKGQLKGLNNSWAIRWYATAFLKNKLTLYPGRSLVSNAGFDNSGTHTGRTQVFQTLLSTQPIKIGPIPIEENSAAKKTIIEYFRSPRLRLLIFFINCKYYLKIFTKIFSARA